MELLLTPRNPCKSGRDHDLNRSIRQSLTVMKFPGRILKLTLLDQCETKLAADRVRRRLSTEGNACMN